MTNLFAQPVVIVAYIAVGVLAIMYIIAELQDRKKPPSTNK